MSTILDPQGEQSQSKALVPPKPTKKKMPEYYIRVGMYIFLGMSAVNLMHKPDYNFPLFLAGLYIWTNQKV
jgi:hypothetical protein